MKSSDNPSIARLVGTDGDMGEKLGLSADWAANIIAQVGNYGEMFERNVGQDTPLQISRGLNALWTEGGIQYAPPVR
jgi:general L-amino acid transport system substrate-binding protein